jgi:hypothetical protein
MRIGGQALRLYNRRPQLPIQPTPKTRMRWRFPQLWHPPSPIQSQPGAIVLTNVFLVLKELEHRPLLGKPNTSRM